MYILGFIGPSGTGKSHHALVVAYEHQMECMIDDGLLIYQNRIIAGRSAKDETNRMKAVRCAIFLDPLHAKAVRQALAKIGPTRLLILGTSRHMVHRICDSLHLSRPNEFLRIEDISSETEIAKARAIRQQEGKHIIPVPTMEVRSHFRGMLLQPLKTFFYGPDKKAKAFERSVVRPIFSYYGKLIFANTALTSLIRHAVETVAGIVKIHAVTVARREASKQNGLVVTLGVSIHDQGNVHALMRTIKNTIQKEIEYTTGMSVDMLKITIQHTVHRA